MKNETTHPIRIKVAGYTPYRPNTVYGTQFMQGAYNCNFKRDGLADLLRKLRRYEGPSNAIEALRWLTWVGSYPMKEVR